MFKGEYSGFINGYLEDFLDFVGFGEFMRRFWSFHTSDFKRMVIYRDFDVLGVGKFENWVFSNPE